MNRQRSALFLAAGLLGLLLASCSDGGKLHVLMIKAGGASTCASMLNLTWKCWGYNNAGQLGQGDTENRGDAPGEMGNSLPVIDLGKNQAVLDIAVGSTHACGLLFDNVTEAYTVKCWGENSAGQLGLGNTESRGDGAGEMGDDLPAVDLGTAANGDPLVPVAIAAGELHTCALLRDTEAKTSMIKCWGENSVGQLGLGDTNDRGDNPGEMGDHLPAIDLGTGLTVDAIVAGAYHTCALLRDALDVIQVKCWGLNTVGQLGLGDTANRGDEPGEMGDHLPAIDLGTGRTAVELVAGGGHVCARLDDATVKCWGYDNAGQLGLSNAVNRGDGPGEMGDHLPVVDLGTDPKTATAYTATTIAAGDLFTCALLNGGMVKCWGENSFGQLGQGDTNNRGDGATEMGDFLPAVGLGAGRTPVGLSAANAHVCALFDDATAACWGRNDVGQLGQGDDEPPVPPHATIHRGDEPDEMGENLPLIDVGAWSHESW
jgi:alpha-tubulin suppressor-like RCC1 family protein